MADLTFRNGGVELARKGMAWTLRNYPLMVEKQQFLRKEKPQEFKVGKDTTHYSEWVMKLQHQEGEDWISVSLEATTPPPGIPINDINVQWTLEVVGEDDTVFVRKKTGTEDADATVQGEARFWRFLIPNFLNVKEMPPLVNKTDLVIRSYLFLIG